MDNSLTREEIALLNRYWRAANYLAAGQIYLLDNPLLHIPLTLEHIKPRLLGHWGTSPGLNFLYLHLNRIIKKTNAHVLFVTGPGHGAPALLANTYLEGSYTDFYPEITQDEHGMKKLFRQFSFPGGVPSHVAAETPGSIHEGGELGYSLAHSFGAVLDNRELIAACVIGDGEAETGPLAASWHSNKFLNPARDGAVLPILHLNGYKIAQTTVLSRMPKEELISLFKGYGYTPYFVEGEDPEQMHQDLAKAFAAIFADIKTIQKKAEEEKNIERPTWPMLIFRSPKGWTGPKIVDGLPVEGTWRSHQVPLSGLKENKTHLKQLEQWLLSYKPQELFDAKGALLPELAALAPKGELRMGASPYANGGTQLKELILPNFADYGLKISSPGIEKNEATRVLGNFLRDIFKLNQERANFRLFGPDETASNRLTAVFEVTDRVFLDKRLDTDASLSPDGRVMEVLSEHLCQGWLEGYLLTGRHGFFSCYEAFIHIIDSMFNQHAKWLSVCNKISWRKPIASLNYLLTSHVWRQDHNGFSHQDPGFIGHALNKKADVVRIYLPPDANTLLAVANHCLQSKNYINLIISGKQPELQWLTMTQAIKHCACGIGIWEWASNDFGAMPDVIFASAGDVPTVEALAAVALLRKHFSDIKIRFINVVDLMTLQPRTTHPHGLDDIDYNALFPPNIPVIFAFHGYPHVIHQLIYKRANAFHVHVKGYNEEGTTTTPFDMTVLNKLDRFHLANDALDHIPRLLAQAGYMKKYTKEKLLEHKSYICAHGEDMPEIRNWSWPFPHENLNTQ